MKICKEEIAALVRGMGGSDPLLFGWAMSPPMELTAASPSASSGGGGYSSSMPETINPTLVLTPTFGNGPTLYGAPVTPVYETHTYETAGFNGRTTLVTVETTNVAYYTNGNMCLNPAALDFGNSRGGSSSSDSGGGAVAGAVAGDTSYGNSAANPSASYSGGGDSSGGGSGGGGGGDGNE